MQACNRMGFACVPLYDTLGENAVEYIIDHSESCFLIVAAPKLEAFAAALPKITTPLLGVVYWGKDASPDALSKITAKGARLHSSATDNGTLIYKAMQQSVRFHKCRWQLQRSCLLQVSR
jgi:long-subunit acyl-CoA synthetase (AMP-forming)